MKKNDCLPGFAHHWHIDFANQGVCQTCGQTKNFAALLAKYDSVSVDPVRRSLRSGEQLEARRLRNEGYSVGQLCLYFGATPNAVVKALTPAPATLPALEWPSLVPCDIF